MSGNYKERYTPNPIGANGSFRLTGSQAGGFLPVTGGTLTIADPEGVVLVNAVPVTAGVYLPLPFYIASRVTGQLGGLVTLAGGASGTLGT